MSADDARKELAEARGKKLKEVVGLLTTAAFVASLDGANVAMFSVSPEMPKELNAPRTMVFVLSGRFPEDIRSGLQEYIAGAVQDLSGSGQCGDVIANEQRGFDKPQPSDDE